jgi:hypothetical protein
MSACLAELLTTSAAVLLLRMQLLTLRHHCTSADHHTDAPDLSVCKVLCDNSTVGRAGQQGLINSDITFLCCFYIELIALCQLQAVAVTGLVLCNL